MRQSEETILDLILDILRRIEYARALALDANVKPQLIDLYDDVAKELQSLFDIIRIRSLGTNYVNKLRKDIERIRLRFPSSPNPGASMTLHEGDKSTFKGQFEREERDLLQAHELYKFTFNFFSRIDFLNNNLVIVGANGSGKTLLAESLKSHIKENGVVISAQKILDIPAYTTVRSFAIAERQLKEMQLSDKTNKQSGSVLAEEFGILLQAMISENALYHHNYVGQIQECYNHKIAIAPPQPTKFEISLALWNLIFNHRQLVCLDGINILVKNGSGDIYPAMALSEGEKTALFFISQVMLAPQDSFIITDEPESHLHPSIHKKLWDLLETTRKDCIFIYLTHDLDFATSRISSKRLWLKTTTFPDNYELVEIPHNVIPELLLLEVLGSRQNLLFCEGVKGSLDNLIYASIFPRFTVVPVESCSSVISYTKAFNKLPDNLIKAFGIIDPDLQSQERLDSIAEDNIFCLRVTEIENLLMDEDLLKALLQMEGKSAEQLMSIQEKVLDLLSNVIEEQVALFVSAKVNNYFNDSHVSAGKSVVELEVNVAKFLGKLDVALWAKDRRDVLSAIVQRNDYAEAIRHIKNKGTLLSIVKPFFKGKEYKDLVVSHLRTYKEMRDYVMKYFPEALITVH